MRLIELYKRYLDEARFPWEDFPSADSSEYDAAGERERAEREKRLLKRAGSPYAANKGPSTSNSNVGWLNKKHDDTMWELLNDMLIGGPRKEDEEFAEQIIRSAFPPVSNVNTQFSDRQSRPLTLEEIERMRSYVEYRKSVETEWSDGSYLIGGQTFIEAFKQMFDDLERGT